MNFRSTIQIAPAKTSITHKQNVLCLGSCFAQNIAKKLNNSGFNASNPFGTLYNPQSIANTLHYLQQPTTISAQELVHHKEQWHHMDFHSDFSHPNRDTALQQINHAIAQAHQAWQNSHVLILTLGTAWCYTWQKSGQIVGNCHQLPAQEFTRSRLSQQQIVTLLQTICTQAANKQVILTVSPIRHWKDGAHQNQLSKALLLLACEQVTQTCPNAQYFPSYEIMTDELRDYRFYADDMMHPSAIAIQYIWERFADTYFSKTTQQACIEYQKIQQMQQHKPSNTLSEAHQQLQEKIATQLQNWEKNNRQGD